MLLAEHPCEYIRSMDALKHNIFINYKTLSSAVFQCVQTEEGARKFLECCKVGNFRVRMEYDR